MSYDPKDYYYGYGHMNVNEDALYSANNKIMQHGTVAMSINRCENAIDNATLTIEIGFNVRKN